MLHTNIINIISLILKKNIKQFENIILKEGELNIDIHLKNKIVSILNDNINHFINSDTSKIIKFISKEDLVLEFGKVPFGLSKFIDIALLIDVQGDIKAEEIEIKKTESDKIPGSSIQQVNLSKTVIFFKYSEKIDVEVGYYADMICDNIPFPDRSPRPMVSFDKLKKSKNKNRENLSFEKENEKLKNNWKNQLAETWIKQYVSGKYQKGWFGEVLKIYNEKLLKINDKK